MDWPSMSAGLIGATVGLTELVGRYRDQPLKVFRVASAWLYIVLNAGASVVAMYVIRTFHWNFGQVEGASIAITQIFAASFGAMGILRSSFYNFKLDGQTVPIGGAVILMSLLSAADRGVDRKLMQSRSEIAERIMRGVSFEKARQALPTYCLMLLRNLGHEEQQKLRIAVDALASGNMSDELKARSLGLLLLDIVGPSGLETAVKALNGEIKSPALVETLVRRQSESSEMS